MFEKVLVANRGEIALRILRTLRDMGIPSALVHSSVDAGSLPVRLAQEAYLIEGAEPHRAYLDGEAIVRIAKRCGASAVHPGYGFLAERADFSEMCRRAGLAFIGPPPEVLERTSDKNTTRTIVRDAGVPVIPGFDTSPASAEEAEEMAWSLGFPVLMKASLGGGGRGIRVVHDPEEMRTTFAAACLEAERAFGRSAVYLEKLVEEPRHIEIQILVDARGEGISLGERECSMQRRYQKVIEEAPSPFLNDGLRAKMGEAALKAAAALGFKGAGTVEFLVGRDRKFHFCELNPRIQVEHGVTELLTGVDIVAAQVVIAAGLPLEMPAARIRPRGWAFECRITCEDPSANLLPHPGTVEALRFPLGPSVRVDSHIFPGYEIPPHYDSLLAKILTWGSDRDTARRRMLRALDELLIEGVPTPTPLYRFILDHPEFRRGDFTTSFVERALKEYRFYQESPELDWNEASVSSWGAE